MVLCKNCNPEHLCCEDCYHYDFSVGDSGAVYICRRYYDKEHNMNAALGLYCDDYHCKNAGKDDENVH